MTDPRESGTQQADFDASGESVRSTETDLEPEDEPASIPAGNRTSSRRSPSRTRSLRSRPWQWVRLLRRKLPMDNLAPIAGLVIFVAVAWVMVHELRDLPLGEVRAYLADLPLVYVGIALGLTALNFFVLSGYDWLAMRYVGVDLEYRRVAFSAFIGYAFSQAIGNPLITGGGVRYRLYSSWGLSGRDIAKTVLFAGISFWLGCFALGSFLFLGQPVSLNALDLPVQPAIIGFACLLPTAGYVGLTSLRERPLVIRGWSLDMPDQWMVPVQVGLAVADLFVAASVLYVLLPAGAEISYLYLLGVFQIALIAGVISHVPGGLGVFDGILIMMLDPFLSTSVIVGAVLAFRAIFHILPLTLASISYLVFETVSVKDHLTEEA
ncbi:hypothetical protein CRI94_01245 [Longibacter salinarum]|uniref:Uncharacterized protein n=1 Tax=Longibacter salinarum TaxID=1850348 RepID=A0A2A8D201_9BACT|nr:lysylphosphatidylglycerol synthase domain-containing protein [Longibacter salinarum]PEN14946.1 hypothetical protein CRI94_01245 [Longibacter salinarum]